ncbi:MAG: protein-L-isoaspartate(D-aspartate) O-methyltransferase [Actinomycetota bacterium]|nr:protein-L-isoaspartate(D-aspartate) O-methyltransferase [Actinomycetota bacterium]
MPWSREGLERLIRREIRDERVVAAFRRVDRGDFVPPDARSEAYRDRPVAIPEGQTTSQPSLIARMVEVLEPRPDHRILEIGTGLGFQTALLAGLCKEVVSMERWGTLAELARANLAAAGIENAEVIVGDGWKGCPDKAPFYGIVVSAAATDVPEPFVHQLVEGGRLVIPVKRGGSDEVRLYRKSGDALEPVRLVTPARFVPLVKEEDS